MELKLPKDIISPTDISRLIRELNGLDDFFTAANARQSGTTLVPPKLTRMLDGLARENRSNLLEKSQRATLTSQLEQLLNTSPQLQISFASDPQPRFLEPILIWLRTNIHPQVLLQVGLQPAIAAGCMLRTPNRVFDMSLRSNLKNQEPYLAKLIAGAAHGK